MVTTQQATDLNTAMKAAERLLFPTHGRKSIPLAIVGASGIGKTAALTALAGRREYAVSTSFEALKEGHHLPDRPSLYILKGFNHENHDLQRELVSLLNRRTSTPVVIELTHEDLHEGDLNIELCNALTWLYVRPEPAQWVRGMDTKWGKASTIFPTDPYAHLVAHFIHEHPQHLTWRYQPTIGYAPNLELAATWHTDLSPARWSNLALALGNLPLIEELKPLSPEVEALITGAVGAEVADEFKRFISGYRRLWLPYLHLLDDQDLLRAPASVLRSNGPGTCARVSSYISGLCELWVSGMTPWGEEYTVTEKEFLEVAVRLVSLVILGSIEHGKHYSPEFVQGVLPAVEKVRKVVFETSAHLAASDVPPGLVPPGLVDFLKEFLGTGEDICDAGGLKLYSLFAYMDALTGAGD